MKFLEDFSNMNKHHRSYILDSVLAGWGVKGTLNHHWCVYKLVQQFWKQFCVVHLIIP